MSDVIMANTSIGILPMFKYYFKLGRSANKYAPKIREMERN